MYIRLIGSVLWAIGWLLLAKPVLAQVAYEMELKELNSVIKDKRAYDDEKQQRVKLLEQALNNVPEQQLRLVYDSLYQEYKTYNFNKAFHYAHKIEDFSVRHHDLVGKAYGKIKTGFILLSSGMFKETFDALKAIQVDVLPDSVKGEYYFLMARSYYDLADYDRDSYYAPIYEEKAGAYIDSAIALYVPGSYEFTYYSGLKALKFADLSLAERNLRALLERKTLSFHQYAVTASTLSDIYIQQNNTDEAIKLLSKAAIADIKSSTKEAAAMLNLAQLLYKKKDVKNAYVYINQAMDDANYYGARQRKVQVSAYLNVIASGKVSSVEEQRRNLFIFVLLLTLLIVVIIIFAFIVYRQLLQLRKSDKIILETNASLERTIIQLNEAEKIKEEYIGYYFNLISVYINKLDKFKRSVNNKLNTKKFDDIRSLANGINLKKEREELFENFDRAFLTLFPNFVEAFNVLFEEEYRVKPANKLLNTDLRIFALVRLGIHDPEKIASILEYSVTTIYNYKTRIKNRSFLPNEDFESAIMQIKAI